MQNLFSKRNKVKYIFPLLFGFIIALPFNLFKIQRKRFFLVGENAGRSFQDNGRFIYLQLIADAEEAYWCTRTLVETIPRKNQIKIGSIRGYALFYRSSVIFFTHSVSTDIAPLAYKLHFFFPYAVNVSHGYEGLKKKITVRGTRNYEADFYPCASAFEKNIKKQDWKLSERKLEVTGIARFDGLTTTASQSVPKQILFMPTWREWDYFNNADEFENSCTFEEILSVCCDDRIKEILEEKGITLKLRLHPFFEKFQDVFERHPFNERVSISSAPIASLIHQSDILITDYSSVSWDFLYCLKPTIFFQFDREKYLLERGAYIDIPTELFGPSTTEESSVSSLIRQTLSDDGNKELHMLRKKYFAYTDRSNCRRIIDCSFSRAGL